MEFSCTLGFHAFPLIVNFLVFDQFKWMEFFHVTEFFHDRSGKEKETYFQGILERQNVATRKMYSMARGIGNGKTL